MQSPLIRWTTSNAMRASRVICLTHEEPRTQIVCSGLFGAAVVCRDTQNENLRGSICFMPDVLVLEQHRPLVTRFLHAVEEDFRITEAIARNASAIISRQETRRTTREESGSSE